MSALWVGSKELFSFNFTGRWSTGCCCSGCSGSSGGSGGSGGGCSWRFKLDRDLSEEA